MNLKNHFLIASPTLDDPHFHRSVVYICEHNEEGAMGLIINQPLEDFLIKDLLQRLDIEASYRLPASTLNFPVLYGGPLAEEHGFILHTPCQSFSSSIELTDEVMITTSRDVIQSMGTTQQPENMLITLGYSAWGRIQLENEILNSDWLIVEADIDLIFHTPIEARWRQAAAKLGIDISIMSSQFGHA